jgi:hypothetical protein
MYFHRPVISIPAKSSPPLLDLLAEYQRLQQALDILYHAPGSLRLARPTHFPPGLDRDPRVRKLKTRSTGIAEFVVIYR